MKFLYDGETDEWFLLFNSPRGQLISRALSRSEQRDLERASKLIEELSAKANFRECINVSTE